VLSALCNAEAKKVQELWSQASQACSEVERRLSRLQRSKADQEEFQADVSDLYASYIHALAKVETARQETIGIANIYFE